MRPFKKNRAVRELSDKKARTQLVLILDDVVYVHGAFRVDRSSIVLAGRAVGGQYRERRGGDDVALGGLLPQQSPVRVDIQIIEHAAMKVTVLFFGMGHTIKNKERRGGTA
jgi:hypothetical protein